MNPLSTYTDNLAIGLSGLCVLHCLVSPLLLVLVPSLSSLHLDNEAFHRWLLIAVIPISVFSLMLGCKKHRSFRLLIIGGFGLCILLFATILEGFTYGEVLEKLFTVLGASAVALAHYWNYLLCQQSTDCECG